VTPQGGALAAGEPTQDDPGATHHRDQIATIVTPDKPNQHHLLAGAQRFADSGSGDGGGAFVWPIGDVPFPSVG
jgi:hypothetical protein